MIGNRLTSALCLAAMALAGCAPHHGMAANGKICADFHATKPPAPGAMAIPVDAQPVDECARRWAYSLAPSRDDADVVADAVAASCGAVLARWNEQSLGQGGPPEALSLTTGQPTSALSEHNSFAHSRALFYVVEARAGHCAPPPTTNGVPDGLQG